MRRRLHRSTPIPHHTTNIEHCSFDDKREARSIRFVNGTIIGPAHAGRHAGRWQWPGLGLDRCETEPAGGSPSITGRPTRAPPSRYRHRRSTSARTPTLASRFGRLVATLAAGGYQTSETRHRPCRTSSAPTRRCITAWRSCQRFAAKQNFRATAAAILRSADTLNYQNP